MRDTSASPAVTGRSPARVAVVMAVHNGRAFLEASLRSVLAQSLVEFSLHLVDDGSTDGSADIARALGDPRVVVTVTENQGVSAARNTGLAAVNAPFVLFLDADDLLEPEALSTLAGALEANPAAVAAFGQHWKIDASGAPITSLAEAMAKPLPVENTLWHLLAKNVVVNGGALLIRTEAARRAGGYDASLRLAEDWEFWCRLACLGDFSALPDQLVLRYRRHAEGADFHQRQGLAVSHAAAAEKVFSHPDVRARFAAKVLAERRRQFEMDHYWGSVRNLLHARRPAAFATAALVGLMRYPDSLLRPELAARMLRQLAPQAASREQDKRRA